MASRELSLLAIELEVVTVEDVFVPRNPSMPTGESRIVSRIAELGDKLTAEFRNKLDDPGGRVNDGQGRLSKDLAILTSNVDHLTRGQVALTIKVEHIESAKASK
jgi:hypothetical protein